MLDHPSAVIETNSHFFKVSCTSSSTSLYSELRIVLDNSYLEGILKAGEALLINAQKSSFSITLNAIPDEKNAHAKSCSNSD